MVFGGLNADKATSGLLAIAIFFSVAVVMIPIALNAIYNMSVLDMPLATLFASGGVIALLLVVGLIVAVMKFMKSR